MINTMTVKVFCPRDCTTRTCAVIYRYPDFPVQKNNLQDEREFLFSNGCDFATDCPTCHLCCGQLVQQMITLRQSQEIFPEIFHLSIWPG